MKHSILLTSLLILSGSVAACSSDGGSDGGNDTGGSGGTISGGTGGGGTTNNGGSNTGGGGSGGEATVFCDAPTTIFQVNVDTANPKVAGCTGAACHTSANVATFPPDLESANPESRLLDKQSEGAFCTGDTYIDTSGPTPANSLLLRVIEPNPTCGENGAGTIEQMPFGSTTDHSVPALTPTQKQCIIDWVNYVVAHRNP